MSEGLSHLTPSERPPSRCGTSKDCSIRDVASAMGLKTEAAKNSIFRAVRKMRTVLEPLVEATEAPTAKGQTADACK